MLRTIIGRCYRHFLKPLLFLRDPETVHDRFLRIGRTIGKKPSLKKLTARALRYDHPILQQDLWGIHFQNPIGLAAGFDKDADLVECMYDVGFGYEEVGSITALPYEGNPKPRLIRLPKDQGIVVNYGLKNKGAPRIIYDLLGRNDTRLPLSISVAKTNCPITASPEAGVEDYCTTIRNLNIANVGDMYTINISCPNTFGGEPFTTPELLHPLLQAIHHCHPTKPVLIKMPHTVSREVFQSLLDCCLAYPAMVKGVIISNLTKDRSHLKTHLADTVKGGISGKPTREGSNEHISRTYAYCGDRLKIIGVGGIFSAQDAYQKILLGATLLQLITGMIYQGPQRIGQINQGLVTLLHKDGFSHISQAVGTAVTNKQR